MSEALANEPYKIEFINGLQIVSMARPMANHNMVASAIYRLFFNFLKGKTCKAIADGMDLFFDDEDDNNFVPDFMVLCDRSKLKRDGVHGAPDMVAEVLSPSTEKYDKAEKKDIYEKNGVKEYWIIDPDNKKIEAYLLKNGKYVLDELYRIPEHFEKDLDKQTAKTKITSSIFTDFTLDLNDIFEDVNAWSK